VRHEGCSGSLRSAACGSSSLGSLKEGNREMHTSHVTRCTALLVLGALALTACGDDDGSTISDSSTGGAATGGAGSGGGDGGSTATGGTGGAGAATATGGGGGSVGPCDPADPACVACGTESCDSPSACCGDESAVACSDAATCEAASIEVSCDGDEDCPGATCCGRYSNQAPDGTFTFATATCGQQCDLQAYPLGDGLLVESEVCGAAADCAGLEFGQDFSTCCYASGWDIGICTPSAYAQTVIDDGGSCL